MMTTIDGRKPDTMTTRMAIDGLLTSSELSTAEKGCLANILADHVKTGRYVSRFTTSLFGCMLVATENDLDRLAVAYPEEVAAHRSWQSGLLSAKARPILGAHGNLLE